MLADTVPPDIAPRARKLLRDHVRFLSARRRAAAIERAWCRYDGAPHGPRGRYLCDLEHGWTPSDTRTRTDTNTGTGTRTEAVPLQRVAALYADATAYSTYAAERVDALRPLLRVEHVPKARVRLRLMALCDLPT